MGSDTRGSVAGFNLSRWTGHVRADGPANTSEEWIINRLMLYSSDCHAGLLTDDYPPYFDSQYQDRLADFLTSQQRKNSGRAPTNASVSDALRESFDQRGIFASQLDKRIPALESEGFVGEVLFPDSGNSGAQNLIPFSEHFGGIGDYEPELHAAALRAYNRWLGEATIPDRQVGLGLIPLYDPEYAADQARGLRALGLCGVMPAWDGIDPSFSELFDERFDPMWAALAADALPVNFHASAGVPERRYAAERATSRGKLVIAAESNLWPRRPLWHLIFGGVLERHPTLRVGFVETFSDWIPRTLAFMDWLWEVRSDAGTLEVCPLRPSEYWSRQCFTGASPISLYEAEHVDEFAEGTLTCGIDFPHASSPWGKSQEYLQATVGAAGVPEAEARAILGENVVGIYGLDLVKLTAVAERVSPTVKEILDLTEDADPAGTLATYIKAEVHRPPSLL